jgi:hypothetical protein
MRTRTALLVPCLLLVLIVLVPGCRDDATPVITAPSVDAALAMAGPYPPGGMWARYYPLAMGNHWRYDRQFRIWDEDGNVLTDISGETTREIVGQEEISGRMYTVEEWIYTDDQGSSPSWLRYRQDRDGLYEADISITEPPALIGANRESLLKRPDAITAAAGLENELLRREADPYRRALIAAHLERHRRLVSAALGWVYSTGVEAGELTRLLYPLRPGETWSIRDEPLFNSEMEGYELLRLPVGNRVGARIRITPPGTTPDEDVLVWYSSCGQLRMYVYVETEGTDPGGNPIGPLYSEETVELVDVDLPGRPSCGR